MTRLDFVTEYNALTGTVLRYGALNYRPVEHVSMTGDGLEDFHSSDRARLSLELGYWGTIELS